ncbi:MAG TPA: thioether cross-link-forming SCIFF peptide maturase [Oscillospiraceae bacterium]|nr:thioether cross-link-forming SCIFF peptide maturase [Oscillospiraceae bacterium]
MVHTFKMHDLNLALDVESGALHILDDASYYAVEMLIKGAAPLEVKQALAAAFGQAMAEQVAAEIADLQTQGLLFSEKRALDLTTDDAVKALCLNLAHECNMRCTYCFASEGHYGGTRGLMPLDTAKEAVDFLLRASKERRHCEIDFFGGEPTLNFDVLKETVAYGREQAAKLDKVLKFTITTNALHLTEEMISFINDEQLSLVLSLDGREAVHDRFRVLPSGAGSWRQVLANCQKIVAGRQDNNYYLRGTYTRHNLDFAEDVKEMVRHGFTSLSLEPVVLAAEAEQALQQEDLPSLFAEYEKLVALLWDWEQEGKKIYFFHFELDLHQGPCAKKRALGCGAGNAYLAVTPDGKIYPCHQFADQAEFCAGQVATGVDSDSLNRFQVVDSVEKEACRDCFARFFCGGGCHAAAWNINHDFLKPYALGCELHRKRVECGLYLQAKRSLAKMNG